MATRYWVGGAGTWNSSSTTNWSASSGGTGGASAPTIADDVIFDANSGTGDATTSGSISAKSINTTGTSINLTGGGAISVAGNVTLISNNLTGSLTFTATATFIYTDIWLTTDVFIDAGAGTVTLGAALDIFGTAYLTLVSGTFSTGSNYTLTAAGGLVFSGSSAKTLNLNGSTVNLGGNSSFVSTNLTVNAGTSTINLSNSTLTAASSGTTLYKVVIGSGGGTLNGTFTLNTLTLTGPSSVGLVTVRIVHTASESITTGTLNTTGTTAINRITLSGTGTAQGTINVTTFSVSDVDISNIALGSVKSGTRLGNLGNNTNITFPTPKTVYWNLSGTQNWSATGWATNTGGTPALNNFPLAQDTAVFDNTGAAGTITVNAGWRVGTVDMSARTTGMTLTVSSALGVYGNWINGSGTTISGTSSIFFSGFSSQTITSAGRTYGCSITAASTSLTLQDDLTTNTNNATAFTANGAFDLNGKTLTLSGTGAFSQSGAITFNGGTISVAASGTAYSASSPATTVAGTGTGTIKLISASAKTFSGGGITFNCTLDQSGAGALTISGVNTFNNISSSYTSTAAATITLAANQTVVNFTAAGTAGKLLTLNSSVVGTQRTLTKSGGGTVSVDYMNIKDSVAAGSGAVWYAGVNSTNSGNNTGWIFSVPGSAGFMIFFM